MSEIGISALCPEHFRGMEHSPDVGTGPGQPREDPFHEPPALLSLPRARLGQPPTLSAWGPQVSESCGGHGCGLCAERGHFGALRTQVASLSHLVVQGGDPGCAVRQSLVLGQSAAPQRLEACYVRRVA